MAFSTELVLAAQTGPSVESYLISTPALTNASGGTAASQAVGEGEWLAVWTAGTNSNNSTSFTLNVAGNSTTISISGSGGYFSNGTILSHFGTITGPANISASANRRMYSGTLRIARIG